MRKKVLTLLAVSAGLMVASLEVRHAAKDINGREEACMRQMVMYDNKLTNILAYAAMGTNSDDTVKHLEVAISELDQLQNEIDEYYRTNSLP